MFRRSPAGPVGDPRAPWTLTFGPASRAVLLVAGALAPALAVPSPGAAQDRPFSSRCGAAVHEEERGSGTIFLPQGRLFCQLAADPKAEQSFLSVIQGDFATIADPDPDAETTVGAVGIGDDFPLLRWTAPRTGTAVQVDVSGAVFAQLNLDRRSFDLINADYLVGVPVTLRHQGFSARARIYHQSSHLGDEFILSREPERLNVSFESLELILSQEAGPVRVYGGGEAFFRKEPTDLPSKLAHGGIELRSAQLGQGRLLAALDVKAVDDADWEVAWSARAGVEIARIPTPGHPARVLSLLGTYYDGPAPYGQFYREDISFFGVGLHFSL